MHLELSIGEKRPKYRKPQILKGRYKIRETGLEIVQRFLCIPHPHLSSNFDICCLPPSLKGKNTPSPKSINNSCNHPLARFSSHSPHSQIALTHHPTTSLPLQPHPPHPPQPHPPNHNRQQNPPKTNPKRNPIPLHQPIFPRTLGLLRHRRSYTRHDRQTERSAELRDGLEDGAAEGLGAVREGGGDDEGGDGEEDYSSIDDTG